MTIKQELYKIICEQTGCDKELFSIEQYLRESWITEENILKAIKTLIKRKIK